MSKRETFFINVQIVWQTGERPLFTSEIQVHTFDENGVSGQMPLLELSEVEGELINEAAQTLAGYAMGIYQTRKEGK